MAVDGCCDVVWNDRMTLMEGIFENMWTNTNILTDRSFKFHLIPQNVLFSLAQLHPIPLEQPLFPHPRPKQPRESISFSSLVM